jgi:hypothetical protein
MLDSKGSFTSLEDENFTFVPDQNLGRGEVVVQTLWLAKAHLSTWG